MRKLLFVLGLGCFFLCFLPQAAAQVGKYEVRFAVKGIDCVTFDKVVVSVQVRASSSSNTFLMGDANYRFEYDPNKINSPTIIAQHAYSSQAPANNPNYLPQNLNGSVVNASRGIVSLNTFLAPSATSATVVSNRWETVADIQFNVTIPSNQCFDINWFNNLTFPITGMNEVIFAGTTSPQYAVESNSVFGNITICPTDLCKEYSVIANNDNNVTLKNIFVSGNVVLNDIGPNLVVSTTPVSAPPNGIVTLNSSGTYTYIPNTNFFGIDRFRYRVCGGFGSCDTATVSIQVLDQLVNTPDNDKPLAIDDAFQTYVNVPL